MRDEIVKHSRKEFARKREEISGRKRSSGEGSRKGTKTNTQAKKNSQVMTESIIDDM